MPLPKAAGREPCEQGVLLIPGSNPGCHSMTNLLTYNFRTLLGEAKLEELNTELDLINWDIVGLSEVTRLGENTIKLKNGHIFYHKGNEQIRYGGVGFLIHRKLEKQIVKFEGISYRIVKLTLKLNKRYNMQIIQLYALTSSHPDEETLTNTHMQENCHFKIIMGDFNAKVSKSRESPTVGI